ncbi:hypothetical protein [Mucilaginibacter sp. BT774]|uniref:hypothetical protein n=1 Tax=Mucilaginibacter sp. BT774 TaxID=3062276 RepID=UPI002675A9B2|nr:hypothetical protein [Mucilaginibacter sp. BT774]MDO3627873.1 hypothetical protein [Mucilaginibacter sp. BT774]
MKIIYKVLFIALISCVLFSCGKSNIMPVATPSHADTSTTLIGDTRVVGNWAIVKDSVNYNSSNSVYHGVAGDYFKFTKYGNLYINEGPSYIDTAIYGVSSTQVAWINLYAKINGVVSTVRTQTPPLSIDKLDTANLILSQGVQTSGGFRYEQITFKKIK